MAVNALVTARRSGFTAEGAGHVRRIVLPREPDPDDVEGRRVRRRPAGVAARRDGARGLGEERGGARPRAADPHDMDALPCPDPPGRPDGREAGTDVGRTARHGVVR